MTTRCKRKSLSTITAITGDVDAWTIQLQLTGGLHVSTGGRVVYGPHTGAGWAPYDGAATHCSCCDIITSFTGASSSETQTVVAPVVD